MSLIKPGDLCQVVANVTGDDCRAQCVGRFIIKVRERFTVTLTTTRGWWTGDVWSYEGPWKPCPIGGRCPSMSVFPDQDLAPLPPQRDVREHDQKNETPLDVIAEILGPDL